MSKHHDGEGLKDAMYEFVVEIVNSVLKEQRVLTEDNASDYGLVRADDVMEYVDVDLVADRVRDVLKETP